MANPLKIIIFDGSFKTTAFINRLAKGLAERHEVYIMGFNEALDHKLEKIRYVPLGSNQNKFRFVTISLGYALQSGSISHLLSTISKISKGERQQIQEQNVRFVLDKIKPDIIHLQWPSNISWLEEVLSNRNIPVILSQRGFHTNVRPFVDEGNFRYLQKWYPTMAGFHSVSKAIAANGDIIWNSPDKIDRVVYTGLRLDDFLFVQNYQRSGPMRLLSVGRAHWKKGYDDALACCMILKDSGFRFHYTIIGGAGDEELQFLVSDMGLSGYVTLEGRVSQAKVFKMMSEASLLLMPSVEEGIPNVAVEAMALGLPVLSTDCGGVPELIENGVEGWVVPMRNPKAMADAVMAFSELAMEEINAVRCAARKKVEIQHSEEEMVKGMEELYLEVLR